MPRAGPNERREPARSDPGQPPGRCPRRPTESRTGRSSRGGRLRLTDLGHRALSLGQLASGDRYGARRPGLVDEAAARHVVTAILAEETLVRAGHLLGAVGGEGLDLLVAGAGTTFLVEP